MKNILFSLSLAVLLFAGCSSSEGENDVLPPKPTVPSDKSIPIQIAKLQWASSVVSDFQKGDQVGLYMVNYENRKPGPLKESGNHVTNRRLVYDTNWTSQSPIYWLDQETHADFYCYSPFVTDIPDVHALPVSLPVDQSNLSSYQACDFLWGKTHNVDPKISKVKITTRHVMSHLIIKLQAGKGYTDEDLKNAQVEVLNLKNQATINLATGIATVTGETSLIKPFCEDGQYSALIVPQTISDQPLVQVTIGDTMTELKQTMTFKPNLEHTCIVSVSKSSAGVHMEIVGWETDGIDHGGIVE